ncbi:MAG TPA: hypothetical protein VF920_03485 [Dongiaceae bacterium]
MDYRRQPFSGRSLMATAAAIAPRIALNIAMMNRSEVWVAANPDPKEIVAPGNWQPRNAPRRKST